MKALAHELITLSQKQLAGVGLLSSALSATYIRMQRFSALEDTTLKAPSWKESLMISSRLNSTVNFEIQSYLNSQPQLAYLIISSILTFFSKLKRYHPLYITGNSFSVFIFPPSLSSFKILTYFRVRLKISILICLHVIVYSSHTISFQILNSPGL